MQMSRKVRVRAGGGSALNLHRPRHLVNRRRCLGNVLTEPVASTSLSIQRPCLGAYSSMARCWPCTMSLPKDLPERNFSCAP